MSVSCGRCLSRGSLYLVLLSPLVFNCGIFYFLKVDVGGALRKHKGSFCRMFLNWDLPPVLLMLEWRCQLWEEDHKVKVNFHHIQHHFSLLNVDLGHQAEVEPDGIHHFLHAFWTLCRGNTPGVGMYSLIICISYSRISLT